MANLVNELNSLDFSTLIGGPIQAAVTAQNNASLSQVQFIREVGLVTGSDNTTELNMVEFTYRDTSETTPVSRTLRVPVLAMLNVPSLRIEEMTIDFNAKLTSVETKNVETSASGNANLSLSYGKLASLKASASYQKKTTTGSQVDKTYSMVIHVKVVNDDLPAGLDRMLSLIEGNSTLS